MVRVSLVLGLGLTLAVSAASPALAKGPVKAVIEGPRLSSPITVPNDDDLIDLDNSSGLLAGLWKGTCKELGGCVRQPEHLGPWYRVTYTLFTHEKIVQYVYPYASSGPITYVPAGQRFFRTQRSKGVWYMAGRPLQQLLVELGVPLATPRVTTAAPSGDGSDPPTPRLLPFLAVGIIATMFGGLVVARARRSSRSRRQAVGSWVR